MFVQKTTFILGAGASKPYGFPLGKSLIKDIIENIKQTSLFLPYVNGKGYYYNKNEFKFKLDDFVESFNAIDVELLASHNALSSINNGLMMSKDFNHYYLVNLNQIKDFAELSQALIDFDPVSIDAFLRDHPKFARAGKMMIVFSLLKMEDVSAFRYSDPIVLSNGQIVEKDNWYSLIINDMLSGCTSPEDILKNKLEIITFNYDMSLDFCLLNKLSQVEFLNNSESAQMYIRSFIETKIHHVYGQLYRGNILENYGNYHSNTIKDSNICNTVRFVRALETFPLIKTISEERKENNTELYTQILKDSKNIHIFGFGFDRQNMDVLSFPNTEGEYLEFLSGKSFKYMDYDGRLSNLFTQFNEIKQMASASTIRVPDISITRSTGTSVTHAYSNDFKAYLF